MSLSCTYTIEWEGEPGTWCFFEPKDFTVFQRNRRKRCCSCKTIINNGDECLKFDRMRAPNSEIEMRISGEEIPMSPLFMCEKCGEIYLNLQDIGYCLTPTDSMADCLEEYHELTGFKKTAAGK